VSDEVGRVAALLTACPDDAVVCGVSAARLHGLWLPSLPSAPLEVVVNLAIAVPADRSYNRRPELRARRQSLASDEVTTLEGIPVTTEARTWLDLAARLGPADLVALGDSTLRGAACLGELTELVARARGRRGVVAARAVLPMLDARARSRPESHLRYAVRAAGLPAPEVNVAVHSADGEWLAEPDLSYQDVRLALEYNGRDHADISRMRKDIDRVIDVEERGGWRVVTFGPTQVFRRPDLVERYVRRLRFERGGRP
jgi:hypothetical protein